MGGVQPDPLLGHAWGWALHVHFHPGPALCYIGLALCTRIGLCASQPKPAHPGQPSDAWIKPCTALALRVQSSVQGHAASPTGPEL